MATSNKAMGTRSALRDMGYIQVVIIKEKPAAGAGSSWRLVAARPLKTRRRGRQGKARQGKAKVTEKAEFTGCK
ncbi:hypothetical protein JWV26_23100 [Ectopseudomonas toyotomiensis]|uniref:Uncharacterized protein n=1 Tax=Ectopseudomonas toyotomiensis TaxID=554344 RepID=A0ABD7E5N4_9GAMM|nr:hypothetical protein [Pseudomonas toyotomiensis]QSL95273.1 hypothetical protein JWV26_23100 [Pseudomonas toyotomiensis]